jgi:hypothetical protein
MRSTVRPLRALDLAGDFGVVALLDVMRLDRLALRRAQGLEQLEHRSARCRLEDLDRLVVELDRLHREGAPRLVLNPTASQSLAQLVTSDSEQPGTGRLRSGPKAGQRGERGREGLGGEVECLFRTGRPAAEEGEQRGEVPLVEDAERLSALARLEQKLGVGALFLVLHVCRMTISLHL